MKFMTNRLFSRFLSNKGYTIDQTILIVAIIAILITLVIVTVGWQLINRTSGTKAAAQVRQVEDANGQFFSAQRVGRPSTVVTGLPSTAATGVTQARTSSSPSRTEQAPHCARPQPNLTPITPSSLRST